MQIAQSKLMGTVYNDRIYIRDINTAFHNIGANEHIILSVDKIKNSFFKIVTFHLPVRIADVEIRAKALDDICHLWQTADTVEYEKDLASPFCFKIDGIPDHIFIVYLHFRLNWLAVWRWRVDDAQIPGPHQRKLKCPGYWCCSKC